MKGRLVPHRDSVYCAHTEPPEPQAVGAKEHDVWECDECTANWVLVKSQDWTYWLPDPIFTSRRSWLDRRRRALA